MKADSPKSGRISILEPTQKLLRQIPKPRAGNATKITARSNTRFAQFYPTLKEVAKKFGTYRTAAENAAP